MGSRAHSIENIDLLECGNTTRTWCPTTPRAANRASTGVSAFRISVGASEGVVVAGRLEKIKQHIWALAQRKGFYGGVAH